MSVETLPADEIFTPEFIQTRLTKNIASGFVVAQYLNRDQVPTRSNYTFFSEDQTAQADLADGTTSAPQRVAPGAELTTVRMSDINADSQPVELRAYKFEVDNFKLQQNPYSYLRMIERLTYPLAVAIDTDAVAALSAGASATAATLADSVWQTSGSIDKDVRARQAAFRDPSLSERASLMLYEETNFEELRGFYEDITATDAEDMDILQWKGTTHVNAMDRLTHGTSYAWDLDLPPATIAYGVMPNASNPDVMQGLEAYAPFLNVKVYEDTRGLLEKTIIEIGAETTTAVENGAGLQKQTGL